MTTRIEIQHNVGDIFGTPHWVCAELVQEREAPLVDEKIAYLRQFVANPNSLRVVRITEEVIA